MVWQAPKTNWTADHGVSQFDFNRIESNIEHNYDAHQEHLLDTSGQLLATLDAPGFMSTFDKIATLINHPAMGLRKSLFDSEEIATKIELLYPNGTTCMESILSGGVSPEYTTRTDKIFKTNGTIVSWNEFTLAYTDGQLSSEILSKVYLYKDGVEVVPWKKGYDDTTAGIFSKNADHINLEISNEISKSIAATMSVPLDVNLFRTYDALLPTKRAVNIKASIQQFRAGSSLEALIWDTDQMVTWADAEAFVTSGGLIATTLSLNTPNEHDLVDEVYIAIQACTTAAQIYSHLHIFSVWLEPDIT